MSHIFDGAPDPVPPIIAGDYNDDDAKYEDLLFEEHAPPTSDELPRQEDHGGNVGISVPNRLVTRTYQFVGPLQRPYQILPADVNRTRILLGFSDVAYFAGDALSLPSNPTQTANFYDPVYGLAMVNFGTTIELVGYTGPLWCMTKPNIGAAGTLQVYVTAITE